MGYYLQLVIHRLQLQLVIHRLQLQLVIQVAIGAPKVTTSAPPV